ncbi:MAG: alpha helicase [Thermodesulfobacteriota bacterium]
MRLLELAQARIPGLKKKTPREWAGPCPECGGNDRFVVTERRGSWVFYCRGCEHSGGEVAFLRLCGLSCPQAHAELGLRCSSVTCPATRCPARDDALAPRSRPLRSLRPPAPPAQAPEFVPAPATTPEEQWQARAAKLVATAHEALLAAPQALAYLAGRGLPRPAVERYRLGWIARDVYRPRAAWGLPQELRSDGKPKKLWLPAGILIPTLAPTGIVVRLRIRREHVEEGRPRYYQVPGAGNDLVLLGDLAARAVVVVESDLDALLVAHAAGDLVQVLPLTTATAKPRESAAAVLARALAILVATDLDANQAGGKAARWWLQHYPRARRWPVPAGKDPGEYAQAGGDVRAWVLAGLPPVFHLASNPVEKPEVPAAQDPQPAPLLCVRGESRGGIPYLIAETPALLALARQQYPDHAPLLREELAHLKGYSAEEAHHVLVARQVFPEGRIVASRNTKEAPCPR